MKPYHWFGWDTLKEVAARAIQGGEGTRLEVYQRGEKMYLQVVPPTVTPKAFADADGDTDSPPDNDDDDTILNDSHVCPPICP